jgi:hypothetical protein
MHRIPRAVLALLLPFAAACDDHGGTPAAAAPAAARAYDCAAFAARLATCREEFWTAYASTEMARNNSSTPDTTRHVAEVRGLHEAIDDGDVRFCANMADLFAANPRWTPRADRCSEETSCAAWAACAAPAMTSAAPAP